MKHVRTFALMLALVVLTLGSARAESLMMATTTSTDNTGLLDYLAPMFQEETGIELKWTAIGTGKALKMGQNCDVDVLLVHAPAAEQTFIDSGFGSERRQIMYNDFVIIGPESDPAQVQGMKVAEALAKVASTGKKFVSRGDDSGTNKKEISLWKASGMDLPDKEAWYVQSGQGMMSTIKMAEELGGYTMTDRGTYIKYAAANDGNPPLKVLVEGDDVLFNQYSVVLLAKGNCPDAQHDLALKFAEWMASEKTQQAIADFRMLGQKLFIPNAN